MSLAVSHVVSLGHSRIGLAVGPDRYVPVIRKVAGFQDALGRSAEGLVAHSVFTVEGGRAATTRLVEEAGTAGVPVPAGAHGSSVHRPGATLGRSTTPARTVMHRSGGQHNPGSEPWNHEARGACPPAGPISVPKIGKGC
jgi:hypothetical protein